MLVCGRVKDFRSFLYNCSPETDYDLFFIFFSFLVTLVLLYFLSLSFPLPHLSPSNLLLPFCLSSSLLSSSFLPSLPLFPPSLLFPPRNASNHLSNTVPFQISGFSLAPTFFLSSMFLPIGRTMLTVPGHSGYSSVEGLSPTATWRHFLSF